ncbi:glycoside hydrolase superfamily [Jimgerdemannia flammicorona]|uniref:glucan endo-1,3-beta-D-glucosidase n=1 Tax=Jimgerdemannia flammicorona TaxID=994334 RepID=A0A433Q605_9FUNG|nr:glycoside hydrolase superfamily [Jimgerdemannia flammicorona]
MANIQALLIQVLLVLAILSVLVSAKPTRKSKRATGTNFWGITYTVYSASGQCLSEAQVTNDVALMKSAGITHIRMYGQDCDGLNYVLNALKGSTIKVLAGIWFSDDARYKTEISSFLAILRSQPSSVLSTNLMGVVVGNENVNSHFMNENTLIAHIKDASAQIKGAGFNSVKITTSEPPNTYTKTIMDLSVIDFVLPNVHPYFGKVDVGQAFSSFMSQVNALKKKTGKPFIVGETGWPSAGNTFGAAVPSLANEQLYAKDVICKAPGQNLQYFFFEAFDSLWKQPGQFGVEQHWGVWNRTTSKPKINFYAHVNH